MAVFYEIKKMLDAPIEDVLLKLYPVTFYKWLYDVNLRQLAQSYSEALPQPDRASFIGADKVPKKAYLAALLLAAFRDQAMGRRFYNTLPPATRDVIAAVTWEQRVNLAALEKALGGQIAAVNPDDRRIYYEPILLPPEHGFLVVLKNAEYDWGYYSGHAKPKKEDYCLLLPDAIRVAFKALVPPPAGYELQPLDNVPATVGRRYSCTHKIIADLRLVAEYIAQGHLKYTKSERVARSSLKVLGQITEGPEFFDNPDDSDLTLLRTRLLVGGMAFAGEKDRENILACTDSAEPVRNLFNKVSASASFLHEELLAHLFNNRNRWCSYNSRSVKNLAAFFAKLPVEQWISWENIRRYHTLREDRPSLFDSPTGYMQAHAARAEDTWSSSVNVGQHNEFELVGEPLLKGYAFLLAAFGMAEIAYGPPKHATYRFPRKDYLTPYDGLQFVRLTPLGEFVFGRRSTCDMAVVPPTRSIIVLDETRLLATCRNADQLTELALRQFMEDLAPGRYQMTPKSLLGGCGSRADIEERIRLFRRVVSATPPAIWERFFERTLSRIAPLNLEPDYVVLKVNADDEIRRLLASEPILREIILKVEGLRIAVRRSDLRRLAKRLEQFGYLSPIASLTSGQDSSV
jgi:hypothetical protein